MLSSGFNVPIPSNTNTLYVQPSGISTLYTVYLFLVGNVLTTVFLSAPSAPYTAAATQIELLSSPAYCDGFTATVMVLSLFSVTKEGAAVSLIFMVKLVGHSAPGRPQFQSKICSVAAIRQNRLKLIRYINTCIIFRNSSQCFSVYKCTVFHLVIG